MELIQLTSDVEIGQIIQQVLDGDTSQLQKLNESLFGKYCRKRYLDTCEPEYCSFRYSDTCSYLMARKVLKDTYGFFSWSFNVVALPGG